MYWIGGWAVQGEPSSLTTAKVMQIANIKSLILVVSQSKAKLETGTVIEA